MHIQKKINRRFPDITSLRNQQPYCHTESHYFVRRSHDCLKMQGFYSSVQWESVKKAVSVKRRLRTADCRLWTRGKMQTADWDQVKRRLGEKCRMKTEDVFKHLCSFFSKSVKQLAVNSYTLRFLVEVHCAFARSFNEHPNSLSLRTLICNTFIEGHPNFLQNTCFCCWKDLLPFLSP